MPLAPRRGGVTAKVRSLSDPSDEVLRLVNTSVITQFYQEDIVQLTDNPQTYGVVLVSLLAQSQDFFSLTGRNLPSSAEMLARC